MKRLIKHADIHLRIGTLIAEPEDGRKLRAATETINLKDDKAADSMVSAFCTRVPVTWGCPEVTRVHVKTINCLRGIVIIICRARSIHVLALLPALRSTGAVPRTVTLRHNLNRR